MKTTTISKLSYLSILRVIGVLLVLEGLLMSFSILFSIYYKGDDFFPLVYSSLITAGCGALMIALTKRKNKNIGKREGFIVVSLSWIIMTFFGTLPFLMSGTITNITDAFFESMSGFTTTGASILLDIEAVPNGVLFWRSMTHWIGGMGIIVLTLAIIPLLGIGGMQLFSAEVPGPTKDKFHPKIKETAKRLWGIYILLTVGETIFLMFGEMNFFDAICHSFATMATGGFSTQNSSVANYSAYTQYVIIVFMMLAGMNFTLHYFSLKGKFKKVFANEELRTYLLISLVATIIITLGLIIYLDESVEQAFRDSLFQVSSIITTTGFVSADYLLWPPFLWMILFLLMFVGGMAGSTGGGIKVVRQLLLFKNSRLELKRIVHPHAIIPVRINGKAVSPVVIDKVMAFFIFYMLIIAFGIFVMSMLGLNFETSVGSVVASIGNIGPGIGNVGPVLNYFYIPDIGKWLLSLLMLLGRLELFTVLILLAPSFWKK